MKSGFKGLFIVFLMLIFKVSEGQRLGRFGSDGISYRSIKTLYGIVPTEHIASNVIADTLNYMVYLWVPDSLSETGIRMISPVPSNAFPNKGEMLTEDYPEQEKHEKYFDPLIYLEYSSDALSASDAFDETKKLSWRMIGENDNSNELATQPSGSNNNALIHIFSDEKKKVRLNAGLYRIRFRASKEKNPEGTFLLQAGFNPKIPGLKLFRTKEEL